MRELFHGVHEALKDWNRYQVRVRRTDVPQERVTGDRLGGRYHPPAGVDVEFIGVHFENVDFSGAHFTEGLRFGAGSTFERCDFRRVRTAGGNLSGVGWQVTYRDCLFDARISDCTPWDARFERCWFHDLRDWDALHSEFVDCAFTGSLRLVRFAGRPVDIFSRRQKLVRTDPPRQINEFRGNDFSGAELYGVAFVCGIDLDQQRLPDGPEYLLLLRFPARARLARSEIERWADSRARDEALLVLTGYQQMCEGLQQEDLFANRYEFPTPREILDRMWQVVEETPF